jgi:hypothetical protein
MAADRREPKVLSTVLLGAVSYSTPVAANGTLFIASQSNLWAVQKGATLYVPSESSAAPAANAT